MTGLQIPSLRDKAVIISGGATGIGEAIVTGFARQGARVGFVDLNDTAGAALVDQLAGESVRHTPYFCKLDVTDTDALPGVGAELIKQLGGADVLVNNAANDERHAISEITPEYWRNRMAVNLDHHMFMVQAVLPAMERAGSGAVVNMGSCSWRLGLGGMAAYVTAKAAIEGLTNGLARELGPNRIRVNCVIPGFVRTKRQVERWLTPDLERVILEGQSLPDFIEPGDVADMVMFLASDSARSCTSGCYTVDGGWI